jgi:catechol 2,3-dioxygenase-like lactoylglutathione lyase family enzyme
LLNYVSIQVSDMDRTGAFYDAVLGPLGWRRQFETDGVIGWGIVRGVFHVSSHDLPRPGFGCVSFPAKSIPAVKAAWEAGLEQGAASEAQPGSPPASGPGNYAARLSDPDGYTVEISVAND